MLKVFLGNKVNLHHIKKQQNLMPTLWFHFKAYALSVRSREQIFLSLFNQISLIST